MSVPGTPSDIKVDGGHVHWDIGVASYGSLGHVPLIDFQQVNFFQLTLELRKVWQQLCSSGWWRFASASAVFLHFEQLYSPRQVAQCKQTYNKIKKTDIAEQRISTKWRNGKLPESTYQSNSKLGIRNGVDFFMRSDTEQFAQFVLRVHQLV